MADFRINVSAHLINRKSTKDIVLISLFLALAILPAVPEVNAVSTWIFAALIFLLLFLRPRSAGPLLPKLGSVEVGILMFISLCILSFFWSDPAAIGFRDWIRQLIPYLFLLCYFFIPRGGDVVALELIKLFHISAIVFSVVNLFIAFSAEGIQILTHGRITYSNFNFVVPMAFISLSLCIFVPPFSNKLATFCCYFINLSIVIGCGYRSQILLIVLTVVVALLVKRLYFNLAAFLGIILFVLIAGVSVETDVALVEETISRFSQLTSEVAESSRAIEREYAMGLFSASPLIGSGLGTPVPISVLYGGDAEIFYLMAHDNVRYIHNVWMYLLMNLGILGLMAYLLIFVVPVVSTISHFSSFSRDNLAAKHQFAVGWTVLMLLVYITVEATYRQIQFNFVMAIFLAVIAGLKASKCSKSVQST